MTNFTLFHCYSQHKSRNKLSRYKYSADTTRHKPGHPPATLSSVLPRARVYDHDNSALQSLHILGLSWSKTSSTVWKSMRIDAPHPSFDIRARSHIIKPYNHIRLLRIKYRQATPKQVARRARVHGIGFKLITRRSKVRILPPL